jgi:hypothetical protein
MRRGSAAQDLPRDHALDGIRSITAEQRSLMEPKSHLTCFQTSDKIETRLLLYSRLG